MRQFLWGSKKRKITTSVVAVLLLVGLAAGGSSDEPESTSSTENSVQTTAAPAPTDTADDQSAPSTTSEATATTSKATATTTESPSTTTTLATTTTTQPTTTTTTLPIIGAGTYVVGAEVEPGVYRASRYWARLDASGDIIDNDLIGDGFGIVVIQPTDSFIEFTGEAIAVDEFPAIDPIAMGYEGGTYLVGSDIEAGTYRVTASDGVAYAARLDNTLDIIDNDLNEGSVIIVVQPTDFALSFSGGPLERID